MGRFTTSATTSSIHGVMAATCSWRIRSGAESMTTATSRCMTCAADAVVAVLAARLPQRRHPQRLRLHHRQPHRPHPQERLRQGSVPARRVVLLTHTAIVVTLTRSPQKAGVVVTTMAILVRPPCVAPVVVAPPTARLTLLHQLLLHLLKRQHRRALALGFSQIQSTISSGARTEPSVMAGPVATTKAAVRSALRITRPCACRPLAAAEASTVVPRILIALAVVDLYHATQIRLRLHRNQPNLRQMQL